jgi:hypothetical protein
MCGINKPLGDRNAVAPMRVIALVHRTMSGGQPCIFHEDRHRRRDDQDAPVTCHLAVVWTDIDPRRRYSEQVRSFWKQLSTKVSTAAMVGSVGGALVSFYKGRVRSDGLAEPLWALFLT